jgi:hypothetical protein
MTTGLRSVWPHDRYGAQAGDVLLNGNQALVRALVLQRELERSPLSLAAWMCTLMGVTHCSRCRR